MVAAVVVTVSVDVAGPLPLIGTEVGLRLQAGGSLAAVGLIEQLRLTVPEYPFMPKTEIVEVFPVIAPAFTEIAASLLLAPLGANVGSAVTVSVTVVDEVRLPEVPVMMTVTGPPVAAEAAAVSVSTCVPATVPAAKLAVIPLGNPGAASETVPEKPPT
jgi:hypothetical protein